MSLIKFPAPELADKDGLLAIGGNLEPDTLVSAYSSGIFPWSVNPITWWSPDPRAIFDISSFKLSKRMMRLYNQGKFIFSFDTAFERVIRNCASSSPGRESTWISPEFIEAYCRLHKLGVAHSVEAWVDGDLAGGVYGVAIKGLFAGESMFYKYSNASTLCLFHLMKHLQNRGFILFDSQTPTPHTVYLGVELIARKKYLKFLELALKQNCSF